MSAHADSLAQYVRSRFGPRFADWRAGQYAATDSARYQDRASPQRVITSAEQVEAFEAALVARELGAFGQAADRLQRLLADDGVADRLRAEAHSVLGDLLQWQGKGAEAWLPHMVACLTLQENHELALSGVRRARLESAPAHADSEPDASGPRIVLVLGSNFATVAFANEFMRQHRVVGVIQQYAEFPAVALAYRPDAAARPFGLSDAEARGFADEAVLGNAWNALFVDPQVPMRYLSRGEANSAPVRSWVSSLRPDVFVSHGPERLSAEFIGLASLGGINVHWGLSPRYRGMHTCRWALIHGLPEWVGVTIHKLDPGLDSGPILYQARPRLEPGDSIRRVEYRLTRLATPIVSRAVDEVVAGTARTVDQDLTAGKEYRLREWTEEHASRLTPEYISDVVSAYLAHQNDRNRRAPLINPWAAQ